MALPSWKEWVFSGKAFAAAMLAFYVSACLDLPRPYWAMTTVYVVSHPFSGATRSKAVYRVGGTVLGAVAAVALVPNLVNAPELLSLAMALWVGACLYNSLLDRTPRSYVFMLAAYTAPIIGFAGVGDPAAIFDTALARVEEITIGIVCASVLASVVFPQSVAKLVTARTDTWLESSARWAMKVLAGTGAGAAARADQRRLAADAVEIDMLSTHLAYDPSASREAPRLLRQLRARMLLVLPVLSSAAERLHALGTAGSHPAPDMRGLLRDISGWLRAGPDRSLEVASQLRQRLEASRPVLGPASDWRDFLLGSLLRCLRDLVDIRQDCQELRAAIAGTGARRLRRTVIGAGSERHVDRGMALLSAAAAALAVLAGSAFWITTAWPEGASAPTMAAVACCIFATQDDPAPGIKQFIRWCLVALVIDAGYALAVMPLVHSFEALALAPVLLVFGIVAARPATALVGLAVAANTPSLLLLQNRYSVDFASFANAGIALVGGLWLGALITRVVRSVGTGWSLGRLTRATWRTLANAAEGRGEIDRARFAGLMLDRIGLAAPRIAALEQGSEAETTDLLTEFQIGLDILDIRGARSGLPHQAAAELDALLGGVAALFRGQARRHVPLEPPPALLRSIDQALAMMADLQDQPLRDEALAGLVGLRRGLFPDAPHVAPARITRAVA